MIDKCAAAIAGFALLVSVPLSLAQDKAPPEKTPAKADLVGWDRAYRIPEATDIVVNATSIGLFPAVDGRLDLDLDSLRPGLVVADVIANPPRTQLIRNAQARGCIVLDGLGMLVSQGVIGIRHWLGIEPEPQVMRSKLEDIFGV